MVPKWNQLVPGRFPPTPQENNKKGHPKVKQKAPKNDAKKLSKTQKTSPGTLFSQPKKQAFPRAVFYSFLAQNGHQNGFKSWENHGKNDTWNEVEKTSTKCVKSDAVRPVKNEFSIGRVVKNHENQRCEELRKHVKKWGLNNTEITEKWALELNKRRCLKTDPKKSQNTQKWRQKWTPETH